MPQKPATDKRYGQSSTPGRNFNCSFVIFQRVVPTLDIHYSSYFVSWMTNLDAISGSVHKYNAGNLILYSSRRSGGGGGARRGGASYEQEQSKAVTVSMRVSTRMRPRCRCPTMSASLLCWNECRVRGLTCRGCSCRSRLGSDSCHKRS